MENLATHEMTLYYTAKSQKTSEKLPKIAAYVPCFCLAEKDKLG